MKVKKIEQVQAELVEAQQMMCEAKTKEDALAAVTAARQACDMANQRLWQSMLTARQAGVTARAICKAGGVSEPVWYKYNREGGMPPRL